MQKMLLLPHQGQFIQAPMIFPEKRFFFDVAGYGAGKTMALTKAFLYYVSILQGKKDKSGHHARMLLGGVNLGHLEKTTLTYIKEDLINTNTPFTHDKKNNKFTVGTVTTILVSLSAPGSIVGFDCVISLCLTGNTRILVLRNNRVRRIKISKLNKDTDMVLTDNGWCKIKKVAKTQKTIPIDFLGIGCSKEHRFITSSSKEGLDKQGKMAYDINDSDYIDTLRIKEVITWQKKRQKNSMDESTDNIKMGTTGTFSGRPVSGSTRHTIKQCGKNTTAQSRQTWLYTILMGIRKTIASKISPVLQGQSTVGFTLQKGSKTQSSLRLLKRSLGKHIKSLLTRSTNAHAQCAEQCLHQDEQHQSTVAQNAKTSHTETTSQRTGQSCLGKTGLTVTYESVGTVRKSLAFRPKAVLLSALRHVVTKTGLGRFRRPVQLWNLTVDDDIHEYYVCLNRHVAMRSANCDEIDDLDAGDDVTFEAVRAVNERTRQNVRGFRTPALLFSSTSQGQRGLYRVITNFKKTGVGYVLIRGSSRENYHHPDGYIENLYKTYNDREKRVYLEGYFEALAQGRVFGDFDWDKNYANVPMDREIGATERIIWAQDFNAGYHRGCVGVLRGGIIYIVKRYEFPDIREAPKVVRHDFPHNKIIWVPDATAKDQIIQFTRELHKYGIWWVIRSKNVSREDSAFLVNKLLYTGRLICTQAAQDTAEAMSLAVRDKNNQIPAGVGPSSPIHDCLCGRTLILTSFGTKRLEDIRVGDMVLTRMGFKRVTAVMDKGILPTRNYAGVWATKEHPFYVDGVGMKACGELSEQDLVNIENARDTKRYMLQGCQIRQHRMLIDRYLQASLLQDTGKEELRHVYDITVEDVHEFFANGVLVSNCDAVRMLCYFVCVTERSMLDIKRATVARHLAYQQDEPMVEELSDGYAVINPEAVNR